MRAAQCKKAMWESYLCHTTPLDSRTNSSTAVTNRVAKAHVADKSMSLSLLELDTSGVFSMEAEPLGQIEHLVELTISLLDVRQIQDTEKDNNADTFLLQIKLHMKGDSNIEKHRNAPF